MTIATMTTGTEEGFSADWLALREPADHAARDNEAAGAACAWAAERPRDRPLRIVDLGCGSGSNVRFLAPRLGGAQAWQLCDRDAGLLERALADPGLRRRALTLEPLICDLSAGLPQALLDGVDLVTASALMDLVAAVWLSDLLEHCRAAGAAVLVALTYDGRLDWRPLLSEDIEARELFNRHQQRDKGFGPALGPGAPMFMVDALQDLGYRTVSADSAWHLPPGKAELQNALIDGIARAAREQAPASAGRIERWQGERQRVVETGQSFLTVGHLDIFAVPR